MDAVKHKYEGIDSYTGIHTWLKTNYGKAIKCEHCKNPNLKRYEWANVSKKYKKDISDWIQLCTSCHRKYDKGTKILEKRFSVIAIRINVPEELLKLLDEYCKENNYQRSEAIRELIRKELKNHDNF